MCSTKNYGIVTLTEKGRETGSFLLKRHGILEAFFIRIGCGEPLRLAEQMEHFLSAEAIEKINMTAEFLGSSRVADSFADFKQQYFGKTPDEP